MRCTRCPRCAGREVGRISSDRYYCWGCCCEFHAARSGVAGARVGQESGDEATWRIFELDEEGSLVPVAAPPGGPDDPAEPDRLTGADRLPQPVVDAPPPLEACGGDGAEGAGVTSSGQVRRGTLPGNAAVPGLG